MNYYKRAQQVKPPGHKEELTNQEAQVLKGIMEHPEGWLIKYASLTTRASYTYRLQDAKKNPIANYNRGVIYSLVEKNYLKLLPEFKFEIL